MEYTKITERLVACKFSELPQDQQEELTKCLEEGLELDNVTVFFDKELGQVVLNMENVMYDDYAEFLPKLMLLSEQELEEFERVLTSKRATAGKSISSTVKYLLQDAALISRMIANYEEKEQVNRILDLLGKHITPCDQYKMLCKIQDANPNSKTFIAIESFHYGVMIGKQRERARRKRMFATVC